MTRTLVWLLLAILTLLVLGFAWVMSKPRFLDHIVGASGHRLPALQGARMVSQASEG
jgi:hypothetical protein